jgi:hypothetical protein
VLAHGPLWQTEEGRDLGGQGNGNPELRVVDGENFILSHTQNSINNNGIRER